MIFGSDLRRHIQGNCAHSDDDASGVSGQPSPVGAVVAVDESSQTASSAPESLTRSTSEASREHTTVTLI